ncbi:MAG TPA: prolipoprotein diacylglyceryl transferase [Polyangiaceae bacterium]|nr:prolipoprotein diacylglyceryl transferase [Polyangiaceae bacterium]
MHPILFRIPLPHTPIKLWWGLALIALISVVYALYARHKGDKSSFGIGLIVALACGVGGFAARDMKLESASLPIYSYGVMLGLSLVVGWYLTLNLAERDGLPKETMANCYVIVALAAVVASRLLYIVTNPDEFKQFSDVYDLRRGGLVAYGGFVGGFLASWAYLSSQKIRLLPWADVAVPSLASGLLITRIGCYLFGCDFGKRLSDTSPTWLKKLGTFPHWPEHTLASGDGSPAFVRHLDLFRGTPLGSEVLKANASLPVHPTQIYESLVGLLLLGLLLWQRKNQKFRGQIFFLFTFAYGAARFVLEVLRDDTERGSFGPAIREHLLISGALLLFAFAFTFGIALGIKDATIRTVSRVASFVPAIVAYKVLAPASFGKSELIQLSTSQGIGLASALACAVAYAIMWEDARKNPLVAMSPATLGEGAHTEGEGKDAKDGKDAEAPAAEAADGEAPGADAAVKGKKKKGLKKKPKPAVAEAKADDAQTEVDAKVAEADAETAKETPADSAKETASDDADATKVDAEVGAKETAKEAADETAKEEPDDGAPSA